MYLLAVPIELLQKLWDYNLFGPSECDGFILILKQNSFCSNPEWGVVIINKYACEMRGA